MAGFAGESIPGYGALPHRPAKGLSDRPLETFGCE